MNKSGNKTFIFCRAEELEGKYEFQKNHFGIKQQHSSLSSSSMKSWITALLNFIGYSAGLYFSLMNLISSLNVDDMLLAL